MKAMILAAGRGERLRPLTDTRPKSLVEVGGKSLLEYHLERVRDAGVDDVVINLGWLGDQIVERIGDGSNFGVRVRYSDEREEVLETGGGVHKALPLLTSGADSDPFLVVNADIFTDMPVAEPDFPSDCLGHLVMVSSPAYRDSGDFDLDGSMIRNSCTQRLTFSGVAFYRPALLRGCEAGRFSIVPLLREAAELNHLQGSHYRGVWADVGTPARLAEAETLV